MAIVLANCLRRREMASGQCAPLGTVLHESLTDGAQLLLLVAMAAGVLSGEADQAAMKPFAGDLFKGMLAFFLLDMGMLAPRNMGQLKAKSAWLSAWLLDDAVARPLARAAMALWLCATLGVSAGNAALPMVLAASASYIAVLAMIRQAIPAANPSSYFGLSLGLSAPLNILLGIPLHVHVPHRVLAGKPRRRMSANKHRAVRHTRPCDDGQA